MTKLYIYMNEEKTKDGELLFELSIYGDTFEKKEIIKRLGYKYDGCGSWDKNEVRLSGLESAIKEAVENDIVLHVFDIRWNKISLWDSILREKYISSVSMPEILKSKKFNKKIYGKEGAYRVYLDNIEVKISDEQAAEIEKWVSWDSEKKNNEVVDRLAREATTPSDRKEIRQLVESQIEMAMNIYHKYMKEEDEV